MQSLYVRVIATVMGLSFTGTMANTPETSNIFFNSECQGDVYLLINFTRNLGHVDVSQISITEDVSFSFFRPFLWSNMESEVWDSKHLDLSNNLIPKIALHVLAYLRSLEGLNLSNNAIRFISLDPQSHRSSCPKYRRSRDYLPLLKVLILQRNKLWAIPKGLWKLKSLKSLDLSFNEISQIHFTDFHNCRELENLYLQSNRIFSIHPEAFKNLKKLQTVDLSSNALTTILPMMTIALALPHMDVDLADNQWQCDSSIAFFQNFLSESWRETWSEICNKSIRNEEASQWIPKSKISKATHFSDSHLNHGKKLPTSHTERPQEGVSKSLSIAGEKQRRMPRWVRDARDDQTLGRQKEGPSQDLTLAVCLSVFITFFVAFCLGALARPFIDRLWRQRCQNKSSGPKIAHPNEGFYDEIEGTGDRQPPATSLGQALNGMNLYENQDSLSVMPSPHTAVTHDRASQTLTGTNPEEESSVYYSAVAHHDLQDNRSSAFPPRWGSDPDATAVHEESLQHDIPSDSQGELEMDSDSDEGSLFTLSSTSSEGAGDVTEETRGEDSYRTSEPLDNERSEEQRDNEGSLESLEDNPGFQNILEKYLIASFLSEASTVRFVYLGQHEASRDFTGIYYTALFY
ncbi:leucine-rich repeat-containing protein 66 [Rhynchocyon petersi]